MALVDFLPISLTFLKSVFRLPPSPPAFAKTLASLAGYGWQASESCERQPFPRPLNRLNLVHPVNLWVSVLRRALDTVDDEELTRTTSRLESKAQLLAQRREYRDTCLICGIIRGTRRREFELDVEQARHPRAIDHPAFGE